MEVLVALHQRLRHAVAGADATDAAVTVGDVYQRYIPYRLVRDELGILEFAAYEHALLRLLAGEGGFLAVRDPQALAEIERELASTNPILGIYRDYPDAPVEITNGGHAGPPPAAAGSSAPAPPGPSPAAPIRSGLAVGDEAAPVGRPEAATSATVSRNACRSCGQPLPAIESLRFCPFCGESQGPQPCVACGTPLEGDWSFCIQCGTPRSGEPA